MYTLSIFIPERVVSPGIALAISAMAFPSCCIRDTTADGDVGANVGYVVGTDEGENVGINVGADVGAAVGADMKEEEDKDHYFIVWNRLNDTYLYLSDNVYM